MVAWIVAGAVTFVVMIVAAVVVFRILVLAADSEYADEDLDEDEFGWASAIRAH